MIAAIALQWLSGPRVHLSHPVLPTKDQGIDPAADENAIRAWKWFLPPALLSFILALIYIDPFIGDWDGLDYTVLALHGQPSSMALGRILFVFENHGLFLLAHRFFGLAPDHAYLLFKYTVVAESPAAVVLCWLLARDLLGSARSATIAALLVAASPVFILYSGQVMTDVPSILFLASGLLVHLRGIKTNRWWMIMAGAALLGAGVNVRETVAFFSPWLLIGPFVYGISAARRDVALITLSVVVFLAFALGPWTLWFLTHPYYQSAWYDWHKTMIEEAARHPINISNVVPFAMFLFLSEPLIMAALPLAAFKEWRRNGFSPLLSIAALALCAELLLIFNYSTAINIRYFLIGLPCLAPLAADYYIRIQMGKGTSLKRAFWNSVTAVIFVAVILAVYAHFSGTEYLQKRTLARDYRFRLELVPHDAVIIAGSQTVGVTYWRGIGVGDWEVIGTGSGWPEQGLGSAITTKLSEGRRVFLDADPRWWLPCGWQESETRAIASLECCFRFSRLSETLYEVRPVTDRDADDRPGLERLLPENRPAEIRRCAKLGRSA